MRQSNTLLTDPSFITTSILKMKSYSGAYWFDIEINEVKRKIGLAKVVF